MTEVNWNPGWLITRGILGQKSARSSLLRTHTPIHNVKKRALGHFSKLVNMIQCFEESSLNPKIMSMNDAFYCCRPVLESLHEMIRITTAPPAPPLRTDTAVLFITAFSPPGRQEKALASGVALGSRLPDQAQLLRKLQKEQSSGFFLLRTLARNFGPYFLTGTLCIIFHDAFMFAIPQVLR